MDEFEDLIKRLSTSIKASVQKFNPQKSGIEPEDLVQEIRIKLWNIFKSEKKILNYSSYIKKIVNSIVIDEIRSSRRYERTIEREKQKLRVQPSLGQHPTQGKIEVGDAVKELGEPRRRIVQLYFLGLNIKEISKIIGNTEAGTRNLLYRGLNDLKKIIKSKGVEQDE